MNSKQMAKDSDEAINCTPNSIVYDDLPSRFTMANLRSLKGTEVTDAALYTIIHRWTKEGWIKKEGKIFVKIVQQED